MVNQSKKKLLLLLVFLWIPFSLPRVVHAEEAPQGDFGVKAILPENQIDKNLGYFDLLVTPKQEQTLEIELTNNAKEDRTFEVAVNPAVTSDGGTIDYGQKDAKLDKTIPFDVRQAIHLEKEEYQVPKQSTLNIPIQVQLPDKAFAGRVLAGVHITPKNAEKTTDTTNKNGVSIKNEISYNLAIVLQQSQQAINPDLKLLDSQVAAVNAEPTIQLHFQNPAATIISDLTFKSKVYLNDKLYLEQTSNPYLVAPNSNFHLNLDLNKTKAKAGKYRVEVTAQDDKNHKWHFQQSFTVKDTVAKKVNDNSILPKEKTPWLVIVLAGLLIAALAFIIYLLMKRKKGED